MVKSTYYRQARRNERASRQALNIARSLKAAGHPYCDYVRAARLFWRCARMNRSTARIVAR